MNKRAWPSSEVHTCLYGTGQHHETTRVVGLSSSILIEVDGKRVGGIWNGRALNVDVPPGRHIFQAFMWWIGSKPLEVVVQEDTTTTLCVRAPWEAAAAANSVNSLVLGGPAVPRQRPDEGLEIWEYWGSFDQMSSAMGAIGEPDNPQRAASRRRGLRVVWTLLTVELASVAVGPLIAHAAGASGVVVYFSCMAGPMALFLVMMPVLLIFSFVGVRRDLRQSRK
jgi:hypothetical protein